MSKSTKPNNRGIPLLILVALVVGVFLGYFTGELALARDPHPIHWMGGVLGGIAGWLIGKLVYKLRGEVDIV